MSRIVIVILIYHRHKPMDVKNYVFIRKHVLVSEYLTSFNSRVKGFSLLKLPKRIMASFH
jgi:hypothetical protein